MDGRRGERRDGSMGSKPLSYRRIGDGPHRIRPVRRGPDKTSGGGLTPRGRPVILQPWPSSKDTFPSLLLREIARIHPDPIRVPATPLRTPRFLIPDPAAPRGSRNSAEPEPAN